MRNFFSFWVLASFSGQLPNALVTQSFEQKYFQAEIKYKYYSGDGKNKKKNPYLFS